MTPRIAPPCLFAPELARLVMGTGEGSSRGGGGMRIEVYSTCPQSKDLDRSEYLQAVANVSRWSEAADCTGILIYADNGIVDPWLVSQIVIENTDKLRPLVAIQPVYMHTQPRKWLPRWRSSTGGTCASTC